MYDICFFSTKLNLQCLTITLVDFVSDPNSFSAVQVNCPESCIFTSFNIAPFSKVTCRGKPEGIRVNFKYTKSKMKTTHLTLRINLGMLFHKYVYNFNDLQWHKLKVLAFFFWFLTILLFSLFSDRNAFNLLTIFTRIMNNVYTHKGCTYHTAETESTLSTCKHQKSYDYVNELSCIIYWYILWNLNL